jgi:hypothetical protein
MSFLETMREILKSEGLATDEPISHAVAKDPTALTEVKLTTAAPSFPQGSWIEWNSPGFGLLIGEVVGTTASAVTVWHPHAETLIPIPATWVTRILPEDSRDTPKDILPPPIRNDQELGRII